MAYIVLDEQQVQRGPGAAKAAGTGVDFCFAPGLGSSWSWAASGDGGRNASGSAANRAAAQQAAIGAARRLGATGSVIRGATRGGVYWGSVRGGGSAVKSSRPVHRKAAKPTLAKGAEPTPAKAASGVVAKAAVVAAAREPSQADLVYGDMYRTWRESPDATTRLDAEAYLAKSYGAAADPGLLAQARIDRYHNNPNVRLPAEQLLSMSGAA